MSTAQQAHLIAKAHRLMDEITTQLDDLFLRHCEAAGVDPVETKKAYDNR